MLATSCTGGEVTLDEGAAPPTSSSQESGAEASSAQAASATTAQTTTTEPTTTQPPPTTVPQPTPVELAVQAMSVDQKIGQLLMPLVAGISATEVTPAEAAANTKLAGVETPAAILAEFHVGGFIYLGHNIVDAGQVTALSSGLQEIATTNGLPGLLISIDQEGGRVTRITDGVTPIPSARSLAGDWSAVWQSTYTSGRELRAQGFNLVFAPVADLADGSAGVIGDRSYSSDPAIAADMVSAAVQGFRLSGVASVVKHWPGHGATIVDSHQALPTVDVDYETWTQRERVPFAAAIEQEVDMVMVGHLALPGLDPAQDGQRPASVSPVLIETLLRQELGFEGVVVTDALDMGAVRSIERGELAVQAIEAGVDILLAPPDLVAVRQSLRAAVASGRITPERLNQSVTRILTLKKRLGLPIEIGPAE